MEMLYTKEKKMPDFVNVCTRPDIYHLLLITSGLFQTCSRTDFCPRLKHDSIWFKRVWRKKKPVLAHHTDRCQRTDVWPGTRCGLVNSPVGQAHSLRMDGQEEAHREGADGGQTQEAPHLDGERPGW